MKSLLVIGCLLLVADVIHGMEDVLEIVREQAEACAAEQNIPVEELSKINDFELEGDERKKFGCLKLCVLKSTDIYDGKTIVVDKYKEILQKVVGDDADKVAKGMEDMAACVEEVKEIEDECEAAFEFAHCTMRKRTS